MKNKIKEYALLTLAAFTIAGCAGPYNLKVETGGTINTKANAHSVITFDDVNATTRSFSNMTYDLDKINNKFKDIPKTTKVIKAKYNGNNLLDFYHNNNDMSKIVDANFGNNDGVVDKVEAKGLEKKLNFPKKGLNDMILQSKKFDGRNFVVGLSINGKNYMSTLERPYMQQIAPYLASKMNEQQYLDMAATGVINALEVYVFFNGIFGNNTTHTEYKTMGPNGAGEKVIGDGLSNGTNSAGAATTVLLKP